MNNRSTGDIHGLLSGLEEYLDALVGTARRAAFPLQQQQGMTQTSTVHTSKYPREHWEIDTKASPRCVDAQPGQSQGEALCKGRAALPSMADSHRISNPGINELPRNIPHGGLTAGCFQLHILACSSSELAGLMASTRHWDADGGS